MENLPLKIRLRNAAFFILIYIIFICILGNDKQFYFSFSRLKTA